MRSLIFFLSVLLMPPTFLMSQTTNELDKKGLKNGVWKEVYKNGKVKFTGNYSHGKPLGKFINFSEEGLKISELLYKENDTVHAVFFNINGNKTGEGLYINKLKDGDWSFYGNNEVLLKKEHYVKGLREGVSFLYHENKQIAQVDTFLNDKIHGLQLKYYPSGQKRSEIMFSNGENSGKYIEYFPNGGFKSIGKYFDGLAEGNWAYYNEEGEINVKEQYSRGKRTSSVIFNGEVKEYYKNSDEILKSVYLFKNGKKNGPFIEFYNAGGWKYQDIEYDQMKEPGRPAEKVRVFVGEKIKKKGTYKNGLLNGNVRYYNEVGEVEKTEVYELGKLIETK